MRKFRKFLSGLLVVGLLLPNVMVGSVEAATKPDASSATVAAQSASVAAPSTTVADASNDAQEPAYVPGEAIVCFKTGDVPASKPEKQVKQEMEASLEKESSIDDAEALKLAMEYLCDYIGDDPEDVADTPEKIWDYFNSDWGSGDPIPMVLKQRSRVVKDSGFNPNREDDNESRKKAEGATYDEYVDAVAASLKDDFEYSPVTALEFARDDFKDITKACYSATKDPKEAAKEIDAKYMGGNESHKKAEGHEGWDGWEEVEGLEGSIEGIENLAYELRSCIRGAKTHCKDWKALSRYIKDLASNLDDAAELMAYKTDDDEDESKKKNPSKDFSPTVEEDENGKKKSH